MFTQWETALIVCLLTLIGSFATQRLMKLVDKKYSRDLKLFEKSIQAYENLVTDASPLGIFLRIPVLMENSIQYYSIVDMLQTPKKFSDTIINFRDKYAKYVVYLDIETQLICSKLIYYMAMQELLFYRCFVGDPRNYSHININNNEYLSIAMEFSSMYEKDCLDLIIELNSIVAKHLGGNITKRKFTVMSKKDIKRINDESTSFFKNTTLSEFTPPQPDFEKIDALQKPSKPITDVQSHQLSSSDEQPFL